MKSVFYRYFPMASIILAVVYLLLVASWVWQRGWLMGLVPGVYVGCALGILWVMVDCWHFDIKQQREYQAWEHQYYYSRLSA